MVWAETWTFVSIAYAVSQFVYVHMFAASSCQSAQLTTNLNDGRIIDLQTTFHIPYRSFVFRKCVYQLATDFKKLCQQTNLHCQVYPRRPSGTYRQMPAGWEARAKSIRKKAHNPEILKTPAVSSYFRATCSLTRRMNLNFSIPPDTERSDRSRDKILSPLQSSHRLSSLVVLVPPVTVIVQASDHRFSNQARPTFRSIVI